MFAHYIIMINDLARMRKYRVLDRDLSEGRHVHREMRLQGGVTPIGAVSRTATAVKMQSKGQGTFWGLVKQCSGANVQHCWQSRGVAEPLRMHT